MRRLFSQYLLVLPGCCSAVTACPYYCVVVACLCCTVAVLRLCQPDLRRRPSQYLLLKSMSSVLEPRLLVLGLYRARWDLPGIVRSQWCRVHTSNFVQSRFRQLQGLVLCLLGPGPGIASSCSGLPASRTLMASSYSQGLQKASLACSMVEWLFHHCSRQHSTRPQAPAELMEAVSRTSCKTVPPAPCRPSFPSSRDAIMRALPGF